MTNAQIICDSINESGQRLTTFAITFHRFVLAEFNTHRVFSRNFRSSRAVPTKKLIEEVRSDELRAAPVFWGKNQKGMQAVEELTGDELTTVKLLWKSAARHAASQAELMAELGAHKQIVNRLLEPFLYVHGVVTSTEWLNFFGLRLDAAAQPEIKKLAELMWAAYKRSEPDKLFTGCWHLPYVETADFQALGEEDGICCDASSPAIKVSVARCARVSYTSFETGKRSTVEEDLKLYDRLLAMQPVHASPAEHQATSDRRKTVGPIGEMWEDWEYPEQHANFIGWRQFRKMLPGEACAPLPAGVE
jgi:thymidylate synthase ThyX